MAVRVVCGSCGSSFGVRDDFAGRKGKCPKCMSVIEVPGVAALPDPAPVADTARQAPTEQPATVEPVVYDLAEAARRPSKPAPKAIAAGVAEAAGPTRRTRSPAEVLAGFRGRIEPVRPTVGFQLWVAAVALVMVVLPLIYLAIVGLVAAAVLRHTVHNVGVFGAARGSGGAKGAFLIYVTPIVAGVVVVGFMLKPIFARAVRPPGRRILAPGDEPLLFAFVDGVCAAAGAPRPCRIEVDCQVNASASMDNGPLSPRRDLVLTIGLPLVAGLDLRQFAGVLAHEFGHFSQGTTMRMRQVIAAVNAWFLRVVYQRDEWDETLAAWSTQGNVYTMLIAALARLAVWATRRILWVLMYVGQAVSGVLSRQMEFDADRYEARMVGGAVFAETALRLRELNLAEHGARADLGSCWQERRLPDDFPRLILANLPQIKKEALAAYHAAMDGRKTGLFDTHPADRDRIARARAEATEGIFTLDGPATDVFRNFDSLAKRVTFEHYREMLGNQLDKEQLFPVSELVQTQAVATEGYEAYQRYFLDALSTLQALPLPEDYPREPGDLKAARRAIVAARGEVEAARDENLAARKACLERMGERIRAGIADALLRAGNRIKATDYGLPKATTEHAEVATREAESRFQALAGSMEPFGHAAARRLSLALGLLESEAVVGRVPDGLAARDEARALYPCVSALGGRVAPGSAAVLQAAGVLKGLVGLYQERDNTQNQPLIDALLRGGAALHDALVEFQGLLPSHIAYPFDHAREDIDLRRFILPDVPEKDHIGDLLTAADEALGRLSQTYGRALGRLALAAEEAEKALGLPPISVEPTDADPTVDPAP